MNVRPRILTPIGSEPVDREWAILRLVPGGDGLTRLADGRVAFASGALPGDRIRPLQVEDKRSYVRATRWELISPGPDRVAAACPVAERCGGCDWMTLSRPAELANKSRVLREALVRTGGFAELPLELPIVSAGEELRYRNRLRLHVDRAARIGLYARGSHELVEIPGCVVSNPAIDRALERVRGAAKLEPASMHELAELEIRVAPGDGSVCVRLVPRERADVALLERLAAAIAANGEISALIAGSGRSRASSR